MARVDLVDVYPVQPFAVGDVVRVRAESWLSVIDQPTDGPPTCDPSKLPEMNGVCCVPVALVRPYGDPGGPARWVEQSDLTHAEPGNAETSAPTVHPKESP